MKKEKYLKFGGETFELITAPKKRLSIMRRHCNQEGFWLSDVYGHYSYYKERAWNFWNNFVDKNNYCGFGICSHNCDTFTVSFVGKDDTGTYIFYITPDHNYVIRY